MTNAHKLSLPRLAARILLFSLFTMSACSGSQSNQPAVAQNNSATPPAAQAAAAASSSSSATAQPAASSLPVPSLSHNAGIGSATVVTIHGKIVSVDRANKLVTLEGPRGKQITLQVNNPYNLEAAKPGEPFVAQFYEVVTIRKMQPGESIPPASLAEGIISAAPGQTPGAVAGKSIQLVAQIDAIHKKKKTVDLKGPDGVVETVTVANPANLRHVKVGDNIVITLTNIVAVALDKEPSAS